MNKGPTTKKKYDLQKIYLYFKRGVLAIEKKAGFSFFLIKRFLSTGT